MTIPDTMLAAVLHAPGLLLIEERPMPSPGPGEVLVKVTASGICGSDATFYTQGLEAFPPHRRGELPLVPGHEFGGVVAALGDGVRAFAPGELVSCGAGISCGECRFCLKGRTNLCENYQTIGAHLDGGLAQYCVVPASILASASAHGVSGDDAGLAQPMAVAHHAVSRGGVSEGDRVLVVGTGGVGAFAVWAARAEGAEVAATDLSERRLATAKTLGADTTFGPDSAPTSGDGDWDVVIETTGSAAGLALALDGVRPGARIVQLGIHHHSRDLSLARNTLNEIDIIGTYALVFARDLPPALDLLAARAEGWADVCIDVVPLTRLVPDGLVPLIQGRTERIKTLIDPFGDEARPYSR